MRRRQIIIVILSLLCVAGVIAVSFYTASKRAPYASFGGVELLLEVADTDALRLQGLSLHKPLAPNEGMLFVYQSDGQHSIWMKDMLFSIDIIWLDSEYRIVDVKERASPESYPEVFTPSVPVRYALELSAGFFVEHKLKKGDKLELVN